ncbi:nucleoside deaminase [Dankookia rubra]|uniref:Nucleoside deaminase n=1 Tax=Dankookia rubra TaxID=1442381 RepID=A0A4V6PKD5_9PROT|nr:nucleoside deaminase [Dankookia rubra]TDH62685.1 nucleoside deaminase [Dankookia rubra]
MSGEAADQAEQDAAFMRRAIELAERAERVPGTSPIGCIIVQDGRVIAEGHNEVDLRHDPTAHAEVVAMRRAGEALGVSQFPGAVLYSTLQPCGMCSMASIWAKIGRIVYGAGRDDVHQMYFEGRDLNTVDFVVDAYRDDFSLTGGVLRRECARLYHQPGEDVPEEEQANI